MFRHFAGAPALILGVSGGPDSTALHGPRRRAGASGENRGRNSSQSPSITACGRRRGAKPQHVKRLARELGVDHRTIKWTASKPTTGLQEKARLARYALLAAAAQRVGAPFVITAHTRDDQAETMLFRMARGSGLAGLAAMAAVSPVPADADIVLYRPLLDISKARLVATLKARRHRLCGRSFQRGREIHPRALARADATSCARRHGCGAAVCAGAAAAARQCGAREGRRRCRAA